MLDFKNVAVEELDALFDFEIIKVINYNNIRSVQDLFDIMPKYPEIDWSKLNNRIAHIRHGVKIAQTKGREPIIFETKEYVDESLCYNDTLNNGDILLLTTPIRESTIAYNKLSSLSIAKIKKYLSLTNQRGYNYLVSRVRGVGPFIIPRIIAVLDMYTEQVERQSQLTDSRNENLFIYQQKDKKELVDDIYSEIIEYLISNTCEFIWGELSDYQKKLYLSSVVNDTQGDRLIREKMINKVANYTTIPELFDILDGDYKALRRFIKK